MNRVENLLEDLRLHRGALFPIVTRLRAMALASGLAITEDVKYGGILFASRTGFCGVFVYTNHVTLEFGDGSTLPDPHGVLAGKGKLRRHIRFDIRVHSGSRAPSRRGSGCAEDGVDRLQYQCGHSLHTRS